MSTALVKQTVAFLIGPGAPLSFEAILADSGVQSAINASSGKDVLVNIQPYYNYTTGEQAQNALLLSFFVTSAGASNIVAGIPALVTRLATTAPEIVRIVTWGEAVTFG